MSWPPRAFLFSLALLFSGHEAAAQGRVAERTQLLGLSRGRVGHAQAVLADGGLENRDARCAHAALTDGSQRRIGGAAAVVATERQHGLRFAGVVDARAKPANAAASNSTAAPASISITLIAGSIPYNKLVTEKRNNSAPGIPSATPINASNIDSRNIIQAICPGIAPNAMRSPISAMRRVTA